MYAMAWKCFVLRSINFGEQFFVTFLIHLQRLDHSIPQYITLHQKCFVRNCEWRGNVSFIEVNQRIAILIHLLCSSLFYDAGVDASEMFHCGYPHVDTIKINNRLVFSLSLDHVIMGRCHGG